MIQLERNMKQLTTLTGRQRFLLNIIQELGKASNQKLLFRALPHFDHLSRVTVIRDLAILVKKGLIKKEGKGRSVAYISTTPPLLRSFAQESYFEEEADQRTIQQNPLAFQKNNIWELLFPPTELNKIDKLTADYQHRLKIRNKTYIQKEFERMTIEFSWKSSKIEGNTYTLLDTERLIKNHEEAKNKSGHESAMILNHKNALQYAYSHQKVFKNITLQNITEVHSLLVKNLNIKTGIRNHPIGITGTRYKPYDNQYQIKEALQELCKLVNSLQHPIVKAFILASGISSIQPFADGNKRTSRLM